MNYAKIKKIDEESLQQLKEGTGPTDECLCSLLSPPEDEKKGFRASIKKVFGSFGGKKIKTGKYGTAGQSIEIPLSFNKGGKGIYTTKEVVKRNSSCGKCGCDNENVVLKHSYANIRIVSPDISSICPCPSDCLPDKDKLQNNIKVTVEHVHVSGSDPEKQSDLDPRKTLSEPKMKHSSISSLIHEQYEDYDYESSNWSEDD